MRTLLGKLNHALHLDLTKPRRLGQRTAGFLMAFVMAALFNVAVNAQREAPSLEQTDCYGQYERAVTRAWNDLDRCVRDTNNSSAWDRLTIRTGCNIEWVARSESAMFQFIGCSAIPIR